MGSAIYPLLSRATTRHSLLRSGRVQNCSNCEPPPPVYGWFTEGFDTIDLKQAKALLELT